MHRLYYEKPLGNRFTEADFAKTLKTALDALNERYPLLQKGSPETLDRSFNSTRSASRSGMAGEMPRSWSKNPCARRAPAGVDPAGGRPVPGGPAGGEVGRGLEYEGGERPGGSA
ncbi:MAG: hypothetical protein JOZ90_13140 [Alphaproteobacteria bacterium]|nr:hypothetical protein [Alphaproteobacteria bacterium]MBV9370325.1 hypothetical protein [Alphaproteobacteria bacterium]MBV9902018.1 hypothetical protein [Alphaproteobacteria bacterium]